MGAWTLTAENTTATHLAALRANDERVPAFPALGRREPHIYYRSDDEADFAITVPDDDPPRADGYAPLWMYQARELLEQYGLGSKVYAGEYGCTCPPCLNERISVPVPGDNSSKEG